MKRPKKLGNNVFALHSPEQIIIRPGDSTNIDIKVAVIMPNNIVKTYTLNIHININLPWNIKLELLNKNTNNTTFRIRKGLEIQYFVTINKGMELFQPKSQEELKTTT